MKLDKASDHYRLFEKYVTYEQVTALKRIVETLKELKVKTISQEIFSESKVILILGLNFDEGPMFNTSEEDTIFKIISNHTDEGYTEVLEQLVNALEQDLFAELVQVTHKKDEEFVVGAQDVFRN